MVTLKDIAAEAGVSITTVSNVVHNRKSRVSEKKVAKIWEIIEREHYVPSMSARSLANDQSAIIAMVTYITPLTTGSTVSDPFMSSVAASVEQRTREAGYYLMLRSAESVAALEGLIHSWRLSGLIMTGLFQDSFFDAVAKLGIPVVLIDSYVDDPSICCVGLEDEKGGYLATKHLLENGHRCLVFSQFVDHLSIIRAYLDGKGISYAYLDGSTPSEERKRQVATFQAGEKSCFLISLRAGGTGLNLTAADYVLHMDPWWNPAVEDQAADRAHRIGQKRPVTVYRLVTANTIEEKIVRLHQEKRDLANSLLEGADVSTRISAEQLLELIRSA